MERNGVESRVRPGELLETGGLIILLASIYFIAAKLGLQLASVHSSVTAVWPPTGIALAAFLIWGYRVWPGVLFGAFLANITTAGSAAACLSIAVGNVLEGIVGAALVCRFAHGRNAFKSPQDVFKFMVLAAMGSTWVSATTGVTSLCLGGTTRWADYWSIWLTWWLGDAAGDMIVAPLLLLWISDWRLRWTLKQIVEAASLLSVLFFTGWIVFGGVLPASSKNYPLDFLFAPVLVWTPLRFGSRETAAVSFLLLLIALWGTLHGFGPFAGTKPNESLLLLQSFFGLTTGATLAIAAGVSQRRSVLRALRTAHNELESRVQERTATLCNVVDQARKEIVRRQEAEEALQYKTEELARSNAELDQFATVAAHELQEPLRKIVMFGDVLRSGEKPAGAGGKEYLQKVEEAAKRMQRLVEDILNLSRVVSNAKPLEPVDLNEVLRGIAEDFKARFSLAGANLSIGRLPTLRGDPLQMRQLFENLIGNAFKFRRKDEPLRVEILCGAARDGAISISVKDNGIGFDERYLDRIFKPFQRLNRKTDYEGSGMGLAICERIVLRHGGQITAHSAPGKGSIFIVTLPI